MSQQSRDVYIKFTPKSTPVTVDIGSAQIASIGTFKRMIFKSFTCPTTFYAVSDVNNQFYIIERSTSGSTNTRLATLTPGNYTAASIVSEMMDRFNYIASAGYYGGNYVIEIDVTTGRLEISYDPTVGSTLNGFKVGFYNGQAGTTNSPSRRIQAEKIWGVSPTTLTTAVPTLPQIGGATFLSNYVSANPSQIWGPDQLLVVSPTFQNMIARKNTDIGDGQSNVIMRVPVTVQPFSQQSFADYNNEVTTVGNTRFPRVVNISVTDESGNLLDFNGGQCYLIISVAYV